LNLIAFGPDIWIADGPSVNALGPLTLPTRMIVVRLNDGSLWINSPVDVSEPEMDEVTVLGPVRYLISPTPLHDWRLARWKEHFAQARTWVSRDAPPAEWKEQLDSVLFAGNALLKEAEFFHRASRTLMITDFIQNYPRRAGKPLFNAATALAGVQGGGVPLDIRLSFLNRAAGRRSLATILNWNFDRLILAHGDCLDRDAKPFVRAAFGWLR